MSYNIVYVYYIKLIYNTKLKHNTKTIIVTQTRRVLAPQQVHWITWVEEASTPESYRSREEGVVTGGLASQ